MKTTKTFSLSSGDIDILSSQIEDILSERRNTALKKVKSSKAWIDAQDRFVATAKALFDVAKKSGVNPADFLSYLDFSCKNREKVVFSKEKAIEKFERSDVAIALTNTVPAYVSSWQIARVIKSFLLDIKFSGELITKSAFVDRIIERL